MKVILYIGHHKVGSTALQQFFAQNSLALLRHGILYPAVESEGLIALTQKALGAGDQANDLPINVREPHNAMAFRMLSTTPTFKMPPFHKNIPGVGQIKAIVQNQIETLRPKTVVICSEAMANFGTHDAGLIDQLLDILRPSDLTIYCTLRRPDHYLVSWHAQRLKFGAKLRPLRGGALKRYSETIHLSYRSLLAPWVERCAGARFVVRNYQDVLATGGSVEDFVEQTGLRLPADLIPGETANPSIPHALVEVVRRANHDLPTKKSAKLISFVTRFAKKLDLIPNNEIEMFGTENRAVLADVFAEQEAYLQELTGQSAFFPDIADIAKECPVDELQAAQDAVSKLRHKIVLGWALGSDVVDYLQGLQLDPAA